MMYAAMMIDKFKAVPYVDFFDINAPGTYTAYLLIAKLVGYGDQALRLADLVILACISLLTWDIQRGFNRKVALTTIALFGLLYIGHGPMQSLQREYLVLLPLALALWLAVRAKRLKLWWRGFLIGLLFGAILTVRPIFAVVLPPIVLYLLFTLAKVRWRDALIVGAVIGVGLLIPVVGMAYTLWQSGAWSAFWEVVRRYWPLYAALDYGWGTMTPEVRIPYLIRYTLVANYNPVLLISAILILICVWFGARLEVSQRRLFWLFGILFGIFLIYPAISGKFYTYYWIPFEYASACMVGLAFIEASQWARRRLQRYARFALLLAVIFGGIINVPVQTSVILNPPTAIPEKGVADRLSQYLHDRLKPGETVQGLAMNGGVIHALYLNQQLMATPYLYDTYFYHDTDNPFIQKIRRDFMARLVASKPRFIIKELDVDYPAGLMNKRIFPELEQLLAESYYVAEKVEYRYIIYERNPALGS
jgi:hypothetical protein